MPSAERNKAMNFVDYLIIGILLLIVAGAAYAIYRSKRSGKKCIGCPDSCACSAGNCSGGCAGCSGCQK